jgi:hypothetical protein
MVNLQQQKKADLERSLLLKIKNNNYGKKITNFAPMGHLSLLEKFTPRLLKLTTMVKNTNKGGRK